MRHSSRHTGQAVALLAAFAASACAQDIGDIDRTQPNVVKKSDLQGEWYFRTAIAETDYNQGVLFEGLEGSMEKIRWEVQENALIGFRSYVAQPGLDGVDDHGAEGLDEPGSNSPIVAFPIISHFDIKRAYNPNTGIESNVLEENTSDSPWYERAYIRVDWSTSLVDNPFDIAGLVSAYYSSWFPTREFVDEVWEEDPDRLRISPDYIEFTVNAGMLVDEETCYNEFADWFAWCGASEGKLRLSFRKVDESNAYEQLEYPDYIPLQYRERYTDTESGLPCNPEHSATCVFDGYCIPGTTVEEDPYCTETLHDLYTNWEGYICDMNFNPGDCDQRYIPIFENYGYFRTARYRYDPERGYTLDGREFLINRWNIWKQAHNADGTPIPYAEREIKPVVYYTSVHFPDTLIPATQRFVDQWDLAFRETVAALRGVEWEHGNNADLVAKVPERIFELRRNGCNPTRIEKYAKDNDLEDVVERVAGGFDDITKGNIERVCAALEFNSQGLDEPFTWQRLGDLRYSMINWVDSPQISGPLGYGPSQADPETGEIISANANIYGAALQSWAKDYADMIALMNGQLSPSQVEGGEYVREAINASQAKYNAPMSDAEVAAVLDQVDEAIDGQAPADSMPPVPPDDHQSRLELIAGTALERQLLIDDEVLRGMAGPTLYQPGQAPSEEALRRASPARWAVASAPAEFQPNRGRHIDLNSVSGSGERLVDFFASRNMYMADFLEPSMVGLAHELKDMSRTEVHSYLMDIAYEAVAAHEVGHTLGLRHNFQGSSDALNFPREFWAAFSLDPDPATARGEVVSVTWVDQDTRDKMAERLSACEDTDLSTQQCLRMNEYMYSSIMDYSRRLHTDVHGLGAWDRAAIKFGYGQVMEAWDEREAAGGEFIAEEYIYDMLGLLDYSDIPKALSGKHMDRIMNDAINSITDEGVDIVTLPDTVVPNYDNIFRRRDVSFADYVEDYHRVMFDRLHDWTIRQVPYSYCSDNFAWGGNLYCNRWDQGANVTEIVQNARQLYDAYYLFNNFKRDRFGWDTSDYISRVYSRILQPIRYAFNYYFYFRHSQARVWPLMHDWGRAAIEGLNFLYEILQTPEPGAYCLESSLNMYVPERQASSCDQRFTVGLGAGRYFRNRWSNEYYYKPLVIGSFWDKALVIETMTDSSAYFYRNFDDVYDRGSFSITYYRVFTDETIELFKGMMEGDTTKYAAEVRDVSGKPTLVPRRLVGRSSETNGNPAPLIQPADNYFLRFYAMYFSIYGLTSTVDRKLDFMDRARVHLAGESNEPDYAPEMQAELAEFTNPQNNYTYRAAPIDVLRDPLTGEILRDPVTGDPVDSSRSIGYEYVRQAAKYAADVWQPAKDALDAAQAACDANPACHAGNPANAAWVALGQAENAFSTVDQRLTEMSENLDTLRLFVNQLPYSRL